MATIMHITLWLCNHRLLWAPQWIQVWRERHIARAGEQRIIPRLLAAQAQGIGITHAWVEPGTSREEILAWFDDQIAATPRVPLDVFRMVVARCAPEEQGQQLADDAVLANWQGLRISWWSEGRDQLAAAIADDHYGLYLVASGAGHTWSPSSSI